MMMLRRNSTSTGGTVAHTPAPPAVAYPFPPTEEAAGNTGGASARHPRGDLRSLSTLTSTVAAAINGSSNDNTAGDAAMRNVPLKTMGFGGLDRDKTLICAHFYSSSSSSQHADALARKPLAAAATNGEGTRTQLRPTPPTPPILHATGGCPNFLLLSPTTKEPERRSTRSGRVLSESESLHAKHTDEYTVIVAAMGSALTETIKDHEGIWNENRNLRAAERQQRRQAVVTNGDGDSSISRSYELDDGEYSDSNCDDAYDDDDDEDNLSGCSVCDADAAAECDCKRRASASAAEDPARAARRSRRARRDARAALLIGPASLAPFYTAQTAAITAASFLKRVVKYTFSSPASIVAACFYLDKLLVLHPSLLLTQHNFFKLFLVAVRVASKYLDTRTLNNKDFALVGEISNTELNRLELLLVQGLDCELYISPEEFYCYAHEVVNAVRGGPQGRPVPSPGSPGSLSASPAPPPPALHGLNHHSHHHLRGGSAGSDAGADPCSPKLPATSAVEGSASSAMAAAAARPAVARGSRRPSVLSGYADRRARSVSLLSNNSQSGVMLPNLRSALRPAGPPLDSSMDMHSVRNSRASLEASGGNFTLGAVAVAGLADTAATSTDHISSTNDDGAQQQGLARVLRLSDGNAKREEEPTDGQEAKNTVRTGSSGRVYNGNSHSHDGGRSPPSAGRQTLQPPPPPPPTGSSGNGNGTASRRALAPQAYPRAPPSARRPSLASSNGGDGGGVAAAAGEKRLSSPTPTAPQGPASARARPQHPPVAFPTATANAASDSSGGAGWQSLHSGSYRRRSGG